MFCAAEHSGAPLMTPPPTTAMGALLGHITGGHLSQDDGASRSFQPMNVNFGLFPPRDLRNPDRRAPVKGKEKARAKKRALTARALTDFEAWLAEVRAAEAARLSA